MSFEVKGDLWAAAKFIDNVKIPYIAPSLGGVESLIEMPAVQSYWGFGPAKRAEIGIKENLIRCDFIIGEVLLLPPPSQPLSHPLTAAVSPPGSASASRT